MKRLVLFSLALAAAASSIPAVAQFDKADDAVDYRQGAMAVQSHHFDMLFAMAKGRVPYDANVALSNAEVVAFVLKLPWTAFGPGMQGGKAKPDIWKEQAKFKQLSDDMMAAADNLVVAAKAGNLDALKAAVGKADKTCDSCHDSFRAK
jgi:cytochrome c556